MISIDRSKDFYMIISTLNDGTTYTVERDLNLGETEDALIEDLEVTDNVICVLKINIAAQTSEDVSKNIAKRWAIKLHQNWRVESEGFTTPELIKTHGFDDMLAGIRRVA